MYQFHRGQDLMDLCDRHHLSIPAVMLQAEAEESGWGVEQVRSRIDEFLVVMEDYIQKGLQSEIKSVSGLIGGNAQTVSESYIWRPCAARPSCAPLAMAWPLPKSMRPWDVLWQLQPGEQRGPFPDHSGGDRGGQQPRPLAVDALLVAGAVGKIIAANATLSGAEGDVGGGRISLGNGGSGGSL